MKHNVPLGSLVLLLAVGGSSSSCALLPQPVEIAEVREFPECGGWLPVSNEGQVQPQLVRPADVERWRAPPTREQALELLARSRNRGSSRLLESSVQLALSPLLLIPAAHLGTAERAPRRELVECLVLDETGAPLSGAEIEFLPATLEIASFVHDGLREFGAPRAELWSPSVAWLESLARTSQRCVVAPIDVEWLGTEVFRGQPPTLAGQRALRRETSAEGIAHLNVPAPGFVLAWAPGYEPQLEPFQLPNTTTLRITLPALPDRDAVVLALRRLQSAQAQVARSPFGQGLFERPGLDFRRLADARADLRKVLGSRELPGWLRGNAQLALELALEAEIELCEAASSWWTVPNVPGAEERAQAARVELAALRVLTAPALRLAEGGAGAWNEELNDWLRRAREAGLPNDASLATPERAELRHEARALALRARELDPEHPMADLLEALGAPPPLDWARLVQATRHLDTEACFELLHPELRAR